MSHIDLNNLPEIRVSGWAGDGHSILCREGEDDVVLSELLRISAMTAEIEVGSLPVVTLRLVGYRLVHE